MQEFIEKLIKRLEEEKDTAYNTYKRFEMAVDLGRSFGVEKAISIVNQLAEEYKGGTLCYLGSPCEYQNADVRIKDNNDFCEWGYDEFEEEWQTVCGVLFELHDFNREIMHYCPCCGKKIKVVK